MELQRFEGEGFALSSITYKGQPVWLARDVGAQLGYSGDGARFVSNIREKWADELIEGRDFIRADGSDARQVLKAFANTDSVIAKVRSAVLLTESGVHLTTLLSKKPLGRKLRRWLADEVLPALRRGEVPSTSPAAQVEAPDVREMRLMARERRLAQRDRVQAIKLLASLPHLNPKGQAAVVARALAETFDIEVGEALPVLEERSYSATEMAGLLMERHFGDYSISANLVGRIAKSTGIRDNPEFGKLVADKAVHTDKMVESWRYYECALVVLKNAIDARIAIGKPPRRKTVLTVVEDT